MTGLVSSFFFPNGDPFYADVVLLLHGDSFTDKSSLANVPSILGSDVTIDTSFPNGAVGGSCIRTTVAGGSCDLIYAAAACFKLLPTFTLDFWINADFVSNTVLMMDTAFNHFFQSTGSPNNLGEQGWGPGTSYQAFPANTWVQCCLISDAVANVSSFYLGAGTLPTASGVATTASGSNQDFQITPRSSFNTAEVRLMEIRWTAGVARYPAGGVLPAQTAPWPDHA